MSSDGIAVRIRDLSKHYHLFNRPEDRLKQMVVPRIDRLAGRKPRQYYRDFAALSGVSFDIRRGETVGIVGRNGSGKSTLLQIICGTLLPSQGTVEVNGRIAALLELGAGFNPEFTGRENVYLNGAILGMSRTDIDARFDDIARFADIGVFVDQPVKTYSSGMYVRLAFATAINVDPDILVVDEALAVGDEAFQRKCFARITQIQERGGTILFVSHGAQTIVQLCSRAILMDGGELLLEGKPKSIVGQYQRIANLTGPEAELVREELRALTSAREAASNSQYEAPEPVADRKPQPVSVGKVSHPAQPAQKAFDTTLTTASRIDYESHGAFIRDLRLIDEQRETVNILEMGRKYTYEYFVDFDVEASNVGFGMLINTVSGLGIAGATTAYSRLHRTPFIAAGSTAHVRFDFDCRLVPGAYFVNAGVLGTADGTERFLHRVLDGLAFRIAPLPEQIATGLVDIGCRPHVIISSQKHQTQRAV